MYVGLIPGLGGTVVDWFAYGFAKQTSRRSETFGTGDVRGVIAVDAASNAKEGGALITTVSFGIPGSVTMALLLTAFEIHGLSPGPLMLTRQLDSTLMIVIALVISNLMAMTVCLALTDQIAKVSMMPVYRIFPVLISLVFLGVFQNRQVFGELISLVAFGFLGWIMKRSGWARPPLILGFILGTGIQDKLFMSISRYGWSWIIEPIPLTLGVLCIASIVFGSFYRPGAKRVMRRMWITRPHFQVHGLTAIIFVIFAVIFVIEARQWPYATALFPMAIGIPTLALAIFATIQEFFSAPGSKEMRARTEVTFDMDIDKRTAALRAIEGFVWLFGLLAAVWVFGFPPAIGAFILLYLKYRSRDSWRLSIGVTAVFLLTLYFFFDQLIHVVWPKGLISLGL